MIAALLFLCALVVMLLSKIPAVLFTFTLFVSIIPMVIVIILIYLNCRRAAPNEIPAFTPGQRVMTVSKLTKKVDALEDELSSIRLSNQGTRSRKPSK